MRFQRRSFYVDYFIANHSAIKLNRKENVYFGLLLLRKIPLALKKCKIISTYCTNDIITKKLNGHEVSTGSRDHKVCKFESCQEYFTT